MNNEIANSLFALGGVALGWILSEATGWVKSKRRARMLRRALEQEIDDARGALKRVQLEVEKSLQLSILGYLSTTGPVKVPIHIYNTHFAEASLKLSQSERISFNAIYYIIETINGLMDQLQRRLLAAGKEPTQEKRFEVGQTLELMYFNTRHVLFNINYHLKNKKNLDMYDISKDAAQKLDESIRSDILKLIADAKELGIEGLRERKYE